MKKNIFLLCCITLLLSACSLEGADYLVYDEQIPSPDSENVFALFHDRVIWGGDPGWYVLKFDQGTDLKKLNIPTSYISGASEEEKEWLNKSVLWNWSEAGDDTRNPHIKIIENRWLVFIRGGLYYGLYDIKENRTIVDIHSPWHTWIYSLDDDKYEALTIDERKKDFSNWKKQNMQKVIENTINSDHPL
ncbi:hypothetical protein CO046_04040 [Candidatus Peregrinibacteria bacterium CG_4_9_14_0_2_um_filter_53_11]|nr:MAG: hypothetical protein CO046_04040 [Candidatus Peregrinibacteria bacterium CG_4_9_14_0_2_um_filter_53_11]